LLSTSEKEEADNMVMLAYPFGRVQDRLEISE